MLVLIDIEQYLHNNGWINVRSVVSLWDKYTFLVNVLFVFLSLFFSFMVNILKAYASEMANGTRTELELN